MNMELLIGKIMYWLGYTLFAVVWFGIIFFFAYVKSFKYKLHYWEVTGSVNKNKLMIDKPKKNRIRWNKDRTKWRLLYPLFKKKKEIEPFNSEFIYPGKTLYAFKFGDTYSPAQINVDAKEKGKKVQLDGLMKPIPYHVRNWQMMELKQNEIEFRKPSFWEDNKYFFMVVICVAVCCTLCALTIYYNYKFAGAGRQEITILADAIKSFSQVGGAPVG